MPTGTVHLFVTICIVHLYICELNNYSFPCSFPCSEDSRRSGKRNTAGPAYRLSPHPVRNAVVPGIAQRRDKVRPSAPTGHRCLEYRVVRPRAAGVGVAGDTTLPATLAVMRRRKTSGDLVGHQHYSGKCVGKIPLPLWTSANQGRGARGGKLEARGGPADKKRGCTEGILVGNRATLMYQHTRAPNITLATI